MGLFDPPMYRDKIYSWKPCKILGRQTWVIGTDYNEIDWTITENGIVKTDAATHAIGKYYLMQNTFGAKKAQPSKVESYLEVNTWTDWRQQDLISECDQGLAYWTWTLHWTHYS